MGNIGWIITSVGTACLTAVVGVIAFQRIHGAKRSGSPLKEERIFSPELMTLAGSLVVLGIVFGTDRLISYSFMGAGMLLLIISVIKPRRREHRSSAETG